ncbi:MAG: PTS sugar transporter subunit IIB [Bombilactobacillus mellifer]|nr:PTS sugar transporter subunit IIB [Bombilactobacillus mellifer]
MSQKTIMLVCAAGMSTSLLVNKMQKSAEEKGLDAKIFATASADAESKIESEHPDVLLLGPQVRYMLDDFKNSVSIPVEVINMQDYGMMNGEKVLQQALNLIK